MGTYRGTQGYNWIHLGIWGIVKMMIPIRVILGLYWGIMQKKMETTIMGHIGVIQGYMGGYQNYGPFLDPYYNTAPHLRYPKRNHNFDSHPYVIKTCIYTYVIFASRV